MPTRLTIVSAARSWIGTPYLHQASVKGEGCDCLGLVRGVWRDIYGGEPEAMPAYSPDWAESGGLETLATAAARHMHAVATGDAREGDLLLFRWRSWLPAKHAGIAVAADAMVHAQDGAQVTEVRLGRWWRQHLAYAFRFPGVDD